MEQNKAKINFSMDDYLANENIMGDDFDDFSCADIFKSLNFSRDLDHLDEIFDEVWGTHKDEVQRIEEDKKEGSITMTEAEVCEFKSEIKKDIDLAKIEFLKKFEEDKKRDIEGKAPNTFKERSRELKESAILSNYYEELETPLVLNSILDNEPKFERMKMEYVPIIHYSKNDMDKFILSKDDTLIPLVIKDMNKGDFNFELTRQLLRNLIDYNVDIEKVCSKMGFNAKDGTDYIARRLSKSNEFIINNIMKLRQHWVKSYSMNNEEKIEDMKRIFCLKDFHPFYQIIKNKFSFIFDEIDRITNQRYYLMGDDIHNISSPSTFKYGQEIRVIFEEEKDKLNEIKESLINLMPFMIFYLRSNISIRYIQERHVCSAEINLFGFNISFILLLRKKRDNNESLLMIEYFKNSPTFQGSCSFGNQFYFTTDYLLSILSHTSTLYKYNRRNHHLNKRITRKFAISRLPKGCQNDYVFKEHIKIIERKICETINSVNKPVYVSYPNLPKYYNLVLYYCKHGMADNRTMSRMSYYLNNDLLKLDDYMGDFDANMPIEHLSLRFFKSVASDYLLSAFHYYNKCFRHKQNGRQLMLMNEKFCYYLSRFNNFDKEIKWFTYKDSILNEILRKQKFISLLNKVKQGEIPLLLNPDWISEYESSEANEAGSKFDYLKDKALIPLDMLKTDSVWRNENLFRLIKMDYDIENDDFEKDFKSKSIKSMNNNHDDNVSTLENLMMEALDENIMNCIGYTNSIIRDQVSRAFDPDD